MTIKGYDEWRGCGRPRNIAWALDDLAATLADNRAPVDNPKEKP